MKLLNQELVFNLDSKKPTNLSGKFLIASPHCFLNDVFSRSLIYVASHSQQGTVGLIINHLINRVSCCSLLKMLKDNTEVHDLVIPVHLGGPVEPERGFILHSIDYDKNLLLKLHNDLAVSSNVSILKDIANGNGPERSLFIMGYTGWEANQLEREIENNLWIISEANPDLIFSTNCDIKWKLALKRLGIQGSLFCSQYGHG